MAPAIDLRTLTDRFLAVLDKIHSIAPKARVYLVGYLSIIGSDTRPWIDVALTADQMRHYEGVAGLLGQAYADAAKSRSWAELVDIAEMSKGHALGSPEPWVNGFNLSKMMHGPSPYHPNLPGHTAIAETLYLHILERQQKGVWQNYPL